MKYLNCVLHSKINTVLVDDEDYERLTLFKWRVNNFNSSIIRTNNYEGKRRDVSSIPIANEIMNRLYVTFDHIDGNPLNNQKSNLRECSYQQKAYNDKAIELFKEFACLNVIK